MEGPSCPKTPIQRTDESEESSDDSDLQSIPVPQSSQSYMHHEQAEFHRIHHTKAHDRIVSKEQREERQVPKRANPETRADTGPNEGEKKGATEEAHCQKQQGSQAPRDKMEAEMNWEEDQGPNSEKALSAMDEQDSLEFEESEIIKPESKEGQTGGQGTNSEVTHQKDQHSQQDRNEQQQQEPHDLTKPERDAKKAFPKPSGPHEMVEDPQNPMSSTSHDPNEGDNVDATVNQEQSRTFPSGIDTHLQWLDNGSLGSESADEKQFEDMEIDDATSEISSTP